MTNEEKFDILLNLTWRDYLKKTAEENGLPAPSNYPDYQRMFYEYLDFKPSELIEYAKKNGLPSRPEPENRHKYKAVGVEYFDHEGKWVLCYYERGGEIGAKVVDNPTDVIWTLIREEFPVRP